MYTVLCMYGKAARREAGAKRKHKRRQSVYRQLIGGRELI